MSELLRKKMDWFDIHEFLHEVGASTKLLPELSRTDTDAVTQCQVKLYNIIQNL
jgi:hypothetical protein